MRVKNSYGTTHINEGIRLYLSEGRYVMDYDRKFFLFDIIPMGAPRMTQSDKWKVNPHHTDPNKRQRPVITQYFAWKRMLQAQAGKMKFKLGEYLDAVYFLPMPDAWSTKKKELMNGTPCKVKPDTDNITKAVKDTLRKQDSDIWYEKAEKRWAWRGSILIYG